MVLKWISLQRCTPYLLNDFFSLCLVLILKLFAISVVMSLTLFLRLSSEYVITGKFDNTLPRAILS